MLRKLLKYELKSIYKFLSVFYILSLFFAITTRILSELEPSTIITIITNISLGCFIAMLANDVINTIMRNWVRMTENLYKDESYLTHTLPITKKELYNSKFIIAVTTLFTTFLVVLLSLFIAFFSKNFFSNLIEYIKPMNINIPLFIISVIFILYLEILTVFQSGMLGIILGHKKSNNKILWSVIFGGITYFASQIIILMLIFILGLFNDDVMKIFTSNYLTSDLLKIILTSSLILYVFINIIIKYIATKELSKGVNVD